ncbi:hypothetical protein [Microbacterium sp. KR10-403]|uniref:hypothetical protein n=1 Tax=Microbacterium sp. KR10-403 TaxID=3158581 RepID=UPI0032E476C4
MSDIGVTLSPGLASYEADLALVVQTMLDQPSLIEEWSRAREEPVLPLDSLEMLVTTPGRSLDAQIALQQLVRLSVDAALVVAHALEDGEQPTRGYIRDILATDRIDLEILDQGLGSAWGKIGAFVRDHPVAASVAFIGLVAIALSVAASIVTFATGAVTVASGLVLGLELASEAAVMATEVLPLVLKIRNGADVDRDARLESVDAAAVAPESTIALSGTVRPPKPRGRKFRL